MLDTDIAYAAGYFDGEGTITTCLRTLRIQVLSGDYWCVKLFGDLFGGGCSEVTPRPTTYAPGLRMFRWIKTGRGAIDAVYLMRPYLRAKGAEADVIIHAGFTFNNKFLSDEQRSIRAQASISLKGLKRAGRQTGYPSAVRREKQRT